MMRQRELSEGEASILRLIQDHYGAHNTEDTITFSDEGEAVIWVKDDSGSIPLMANLTNLAAWRDDGSIPTDEILLRDWLRVEDT
jgi:hypothetical protein